MSSRQQLDPDERSLLGTVRTALGSPAALAQLEHPVAEDCWCRPQVMRVEALTEPGYVFIHNVGLVS